MMILPHEFFGLLSDETRLRSLLLLQAKQELCVCEFCSLLGITQPKISRHLALLRSAGIVSDRRQGQWVYYQLSDQIEPWMKQLLATLLKSLIKIDPYRSDYQKVQSAEKPKC